MSYTDQERAYAQLHEDRCNGLLDQAEYEAAFVQLAPARPRPLSVSKGVVWLLIGAVVLALALIYAAQVGAL